MYNHDDIIRYSPLLFFLLVKSFNEVFIFFNLSKINQFWEPYGGQIKYRK